MLLRLAFVLYFIYCENLLDLCLVISMRSRWRRFAHHFAHRWKFAPNNEIPFRQPITALCCDFSWAPVIFNFLCWLRAASCCLPPQLIQHIVCQWILQTCVVHNIRKLTNVPTFSFEFSYEPLQLLMAHGWFFQFRFHKDTFFDIVFWW